jgi:hypothetical protein
VTSRRTSRARDFSVNALALPLSRTARARHPEIVDLFDGVADLGARRLRVLHDKSFHDDPTRALRAARLGPRLGFASRPARARAAQCAARRLLRDRSRAIGCAASSSAYSRTRTAGSIPAHALRLLDDWHVLGALEPGSSCRAPPPCRCGGSAARSRRRRGRARAGGRGWPASASGSRRCPTALRRRALQRFAVRGEPARRVAELPQDGERAVRALARARGRGAIDAVLADAVRGGALRDLRSAPPAMRRRVCAMRATTATPRAGDGRRPRRGGPRRADDRPRARADPRRLPRRRLRSREEALALAQEVARRSAPRAKR